MEERSLLRIRSRLKCSCGIALDVNGINPKWSSKRRSSSQTKCGMHWGAKTRGWRIKRCGLCLWEMKLFGPCCGNDCTLRNGIGSKSNSLSAILEASCMRLGKQQRRSWKTLGKRPSHYSRKHSQPAPILRVGDALKPSCKESPQIRTTCEH